MQVFQRLGPVVVCVSLASGIPTSGFEQDVATGGPLTGPPVLDAPFSADATTTLQQTLGDGTRIQRRATARYYRDRLGRVRVEQTIIGLEGLNTAGAEQLRITVQPDPADGRVYTLDPASRTAHVGPRSTADSAVGGGDTFALPLGGARFLVFARGLAQLDRGGLRFNPIDETSLGKRQISGIEAIGTRVTITVPSGQFGNDRPMAIVDERWESPELKMVIHSHHSDPRTGEIDYQLTNIRRVEPPPALFTIPADYTLNPSTEWITLEFGDPTKGSKGRRGGQ